MHFIPLEQFIQAPLWQNKSRLCIGSDLIGLKDGKYGRNRGLSELCIESSSWSQKAERFSSVLHFSLLLLTGIVKRHFISLLCIPPPSVCMLHVCIYTSLDDWAEGSFQLIISYIKSTLMAKQGVEGPLIFNQLQYISYFQRFLPSLMAVTKSNE